MNWTRRAAASAVVAMLSACGGGGSETSISVSPTSLTFRMDVGGSAPADQVIHVAFKGDGLLVGFPAGVPEPTWLTAIERSSTASSAEIAIGVIPTADPGTQSTSLRFLTGKADGSAIKYVDVPVTFEVTTPFAVVGPALAFGAVLGRAGPADPAAGHALEVRGSAARWHAAASAPWLSLSPATGTGPGTVNVTASAAGLATGVHPATVTVTDADSGRQVVLDATLEVRAPRPTVAPPPAWSIDLASGVAALTRSVVVSDEAGGADQGLAVAWSLASTDADWLRWSPASGTTVPPASATLAVDPARLAALGPGAHTATVTLSFSNADGAGQLLAVPITVSGCLPRADLAAPRVVPADAVASVVLRGRGFGCPGVAAATRLVGTGEAVPAIVEADGQLRVSLPAQAAGSSPLHFDDLAGLAVPGPDLLVAATPAMAYQAIPAAGPRTRLVYDAGRVALYGVSQAGQAIERWAFDGAGWAAAAPVAATGLRDAALALDGRSLVVATAGAMGDVDLTAGSPAFVSRAANPDPFCGGHFAQVALSNDGQAVVAFRLGSCSGFSQSYLYDLASHELARTTTLYNGTVGAPADGSRVFMGSNGVSPTPLVSVRDALTGVTSETAAAYNLDAFSASRDASRVILQGTDVRDGSLAALGELPSSAGALVSMAGDRAFVYRDDATASGSGPRLEVYDLTASLPATSAPYPVLATVALADAPNASPGGQVRLAVTHDDRVVFVSGDALLLVVPLP